MRKFTILFLILCFTLPVFATDKFSREWYNEHYERSLEKYNEPTKNPLKKGWRKIVLWDAEKAAALQDSSEKGLKEREKRREKERLYRPDIIFVHVIN